MGDGGISRRRFLAGAVGALLGGYSVRSLGQDQGRRPNVVIILADDLGYGDVSCYGSAEQHTPHIDALAKRGLRFTDFHSNGPVCSPTRSSLITGCYSQRWGIEFVFRPQNPHDPGLPPDAPAWPRLYQEAGYATGLIGKWHLGYTAASHPLAFGFDSYRGFLSGNVDYKSHVNNAGEHDWWHDRVETPEDGYTTDVITRHAVSFIEGHGDEPFCLVVTHAAPHDPFQGPDDPAFREIGVEPKGKGPRDDHAAALGEMITALDDSVGAIVEAVEKSGQADNTLIFFCSDNGAPPPGSNGALRGGKGSVWEGGHRVPAIAVWPGHIAAGETDETALTMDLFPTLAEIGRMAIPGDAGLDGVSLAGLLRRGEPLAERTLYWRTAPDRSNQKAVRRGPWKLVHVGDETALFNLDDDLGESTNLIVSERAIAAELEQALVAWEARYAETPRLA